MNTEFKITHYYHSGFSVEFEDLFFIFDYWRGENDEIPAEVQITSDFLRKFRQVYVLITHEHIDHLDPVVYTWTASSPIQYIISSDMPAGAKGERMAPGDEITLEEGISLKAFDSTDLGVSYLLNLKGTTIFHAGDLNFWHWGNESSPREISEAELEFHDAVKPLEKERTDIAFFPVDPRQGTMFEAGADYYILCVKPRLLIPMHYFHRSEIIMDYARNARTRTTEVLPMTGIGDSIIVKMSEGNYMDIAYQKAENSIIAETKETEKNNNDDEEENNPFSETDLPLNQLVNDESE